MQNSSISPQNTDGLNVNQTMFEGFDDQIRICIMFFD